MEEWPADSTSPPSQIEKAHEAFEVPLNSFLCVFLS